MHTNDLNKHLILNHHQVAWLLVVIGIGIAAAFGIGYFVGKKSVDCRDGQAQSVLSEVINQTASSCDGSMNGFKREENGSDSLHR